MDWIREHPYLAGTGLIIGIIAFVVFRRNGSGTVMSGGPDPNAVLAANTHNSDTQAQLQMTTLQLNAALEKAALDAHSNQLVALAAITSQMHSTDVSGNTAITLAGIQAGTAGVQAKTAEDIAGIQAKTTMAGYTASQNIAGIQADVINEQTAAALASQRDIDAVSLAINNNTTRAQIHASDNILADSLSKTAAVLELGQAQTAASLQLGLDGNKTALQINSQNVQRDTDLAQINADTVNHKTDVTREVTLAALSVSHDMYTQQNAADIHSADLQYQEFLASLAHADKTAALVTSNMGGLSQTNRASLLATVAGSPQVGVAITTSSNAADASKSNSMWAGLAGIFQSAASVAKVAVAP